MLKIGIVGCGNMGLIYARAFLKYKITDPNHLFLIEKNEARKNALSALNIGAVSLIEAIAYCDIVIIAVKPQDFSVLSKELKQYIHNHQLIISIMAGVKISILEKALACAKIVRAMPNSPCELGLGVTGMTCSSQISAEEIRKAEKLLSATGRCLYFEDEIHLDAVTALSGSGPAYFFYIIQHFISAGISMGLDENIVETLVKQTMQGAFQLMQNAQKPLDKMIQEVASKGGTTEAALNYFEHNKMGEIFENGIKEAQKRAAQLANPLAEELSK